MLTVDIEQHGSSSTVKPAGDLDAATAPVLRAALQALPLSGQIAIDLSGVPFVDSAGLSALLSGIRRLRDGADLVLCGARPPVLRLLHMTGVDGIVPVLVDEPPSDTGVSPGPAA